MRTKVSRALAALTLVGSSLLVSGAPTRVLAQSDPTCAVVPMGAVAPATPMHCLPQPLPGGASTFVQGTNGWLDDWNHGLTNSNIGAGYSTGFIGGADHVTHWRHNNHWMVDLHTGPSQYPTMVGSWLKPPRTFTKHNGMLVLEFEVASPIQGTRDVPLLSDSWPEIVISTADAPTQMNPWGSPLRQNGSYLYEAFPHAWAFGVRMQQSRHPIAALYKPNVPGTPSYAGGPDRLWEINQNGGDVTFEFGGDPSTPGLADKWASCNSSQDPDVVCRNKFRMELEDDEFRLYVKSPTAPAYSLYYHAGLIDSNLGQILNAPGGVHVFFGEFAYRMEGNAVLRTHWDHIAVNPESLGGPPPVSTATPTPTPMPPTPTTTPVQPTNTPTSTPVPTCDYRVRRGSVEGPYEPVPADLRTRFNCP